MEHNELEHADSFFWWECNCRNILMFDCFMYLFIFTAYIYLHSCIFFWCLFMKCTCDICDNFTTCTCIILCVLCTAPVVYAIVILLCLIDLTMFYQLQELGSCVELWEHVARMHKISYTCKVRLGLFVQLYFLFLVALQ